MLNRDIIQKNPEMDWDWEGISSNLNITWEIVQKNIEKPWNWSMLSAHPNITW